MPRLDEDDMAVSKKKKPVLPESIVASRDPRRYGGDIFERKRRARRELHSFKQCYGGDIFERKRRETISKFRPEKADVHLRIARKNTESCAIYLRTTEFYTAEDIWEQIAKKPKNPKEPSSKWKREGRVFAIRHDGKDLFPAFQFADGQPLPIIKEILEALPDYLSPWQTAFWFESGNGWLGGKTPQECLKTKARSLMLLNN